MTFADKIKIARAAQHLTQQELANRCGLSLRTVQNYELGTRKPKSGTIYAVLAEALGISEADLLDDDTGLTLHSTRKTEEYERGFTAGRKSLQPQWISTEDQQPGKDGIYFAVIESEDGSFSIELYEMFAGGSWLVDRKRKVRYWAEQSSYDLPEELLRKGIA